MNTATIIVVDDDEVLGQVVSRVLARRGYRVVRAASVADALELAERCPPRLALLDLCLPDGNGVELAAELSVRYTDIPLILMTAFPLHLAEHPDLTNQFVRVLTKPVGVNELCHAVAAALSTHPAHLTAPP